MVAPLIVGFCAEEVKPLGPVHAYAAPDTVDAVKLKVAPAQTGPLLPAVGAEGALTVTDGRLDQVQAHTPLHTTAR